MATVTMDINELDKLRSDLKEQEELVKEYRNKEKQVKIILSDQEWYQRVNYGSLIMDRRTIQKIEYLNFEEVKAELKKEAEEKVIIKLSSLERDIEHLKIQKESLKTEHYKEIINLKESNDKEKLELNNKIKELEGAEIEKTKDKKIESLVQNLKESDALGESIRLRLEKLENRNWYQRLFNL